MNLGSDHERAAELKNGLRQQREIYQVLLEVAEQQRETLASGGTDAILKLARTKEQELSRVDEIEAALGPLKADWPKLRDEVPEPLRAEIDEELAGLHRVLKALIDLEMEGQASIDRLRDETSHQLRQVEGGRRVQRAYSASAGETPPPRYLDHSK